MEVRALFWILFCLSDGCCSSVWGVGHLPFQRVARSEFEEDFEETTATTLDEIRSLGKAGWTKYDEAIFNGVVYHFYRKPKRFGSLRNMKDKSQTYGISNYNS